MIKLNINHTRILASNLGTLVEGNVNSISVEFTFSAEWVSLARVAVFTNGSASVSVSLSSDTCTIPWEVLTAPGELFISVRGIGNSGNYVLCSENKFLGKVNGSYASGEVVDAEESTPGVIDSLLADVAELKAGGGGSGSSGSDGKSAYEVAVENGFSGTESQWLASLKGSDGINGTDGRDGADGYTPIKGTDYFTDADKSELVTAVLDALPNGDEVSY